MSRRMEEENSCLRRQLYCDLRLGGIVEKMGRIAKYWFVSGMGVMA